MKTCNTCQFWALEPHLCYDEIISPTDTMTYEQINPMEEGGEAKIAAKHGYNVRKCTSPKLLFYERPEKDGATVCDGEHYIAELLTGPDFGCTNHSPNTPS